MENPVFHPVSPCCLGISQAASEDGHWTLLGNFLDKTGHRKTKTDDIKALDFVFTAPVEVVIDTKQLVCKGLLLMYQKRKNYSVTSFDVPSVSSL